MLLLSEIREILPMVNVAKRLFTLFFVVELGLNSNIHDARIAAQESKHFPPHTMMMCATCVCALGEYFVRAMLWWGTQQHKRSNIVQQSCDRQEPNNNTDQSREPRIVVTNTVLSCFIKKLVMSC